MGQDLHFALSLKLCCSRLTQSIILGDTPFEMPNKARFLTFTPRLPSQTAIFWRDLRRLTLFLGLLGLPLAHPFLRANNSNITTGEADPLRIENELLRFEQIIQGDASYNQEWILAVARDMATVSYPPSKSKLKEKVLSTLIRLYQKPQHKVSHLAETLCRLGLKERFLVDDTFFRIKQFAATPNSDISGYLKTLELWPGDPEYLLKSLKTFYDSQFLIIRKRISILHTFANLISKRYSEMIADFQRSWPSEELDTVLKKTQRELLYSVDTHSSRVAWSQFSVQMIELLQIEEKLILANLIHDDHKTILIDIKKRILSSENDLEIRYLMRVIAEQNERDLEFLSDLYIRWSNRRILFLEGEKDLEKLLNSYLPKNSRGRGKSVLIETRWSCIRWGTKFLEKIQPRYISQ